MASPNPEDEGGDNMQAELGLGNAESHNNENAPYPVPVNNLNFNQNLQEIVNNMNFVENALINAFQNRESDDDSDEFNDPNENVQNDVVYLELDDAWGESDESQSGVLSRDHDHASDENQEDPEESPPPVFDNELPMRHVYLGEAMEALQGRIVLEEESILEIPLVVMGLHLVPGQTLPMTVFHAVFQNAIRRCVVNDRVFGIVSNGMENIDGRTIVNRGSLGTLAEIYEFQEEGENHNPMQPLGSSFAIKAKGRQRFNVIEIRRQADGNLMGKVKIRREIRLPPIMNEIISHETLGYKFPILTSSNTKLAEETNLTLTSRNPLNEVKTEESAYEAAFAALVMENEARRKVMRYYSFQTPWPSFVFENYDERILVERVHKMLKDELKGIVESQHNIPLDGIDLSFWLAQNLTMDDSIRLKLLGMDSAIQRLRFELNLLENVSRVISCRRCGLSVGDHSDIFAMSIEGPQATYVNPAGYVHETLTVHRVRDIVTRGHSSTEASWFPGYSWTIVECRRCISHLGWKFLATGRMKPKKFWGLARKSVTFKYDLATEYNDTNMFGRRASTSSTASVATNIEVNESAVTLPPIIEPAQDDDV